MRNSLKLDGPVKTYLDENELPKAWYNVRADMKKKPAQNYRASSKRAVSPYWEHEYNKEYW